MNLFKRIISLVFPIPCPYCKNFIKFGQPYCSYCAKTLKDQQVLRILNVENIEFLAASSFIYKEKVKEAIHKFKFRNAINLKEGFAASLKNCIQKLYNKDKIDIITSVPLYKIRKNERGYNQSKLVAKIAAEYLGIPYKETLIKFKNNKVQHTLKIDERKTNVLGVYRVKNIEMIKSKNILIYDDIITSGNTMKECVKVLKQAGAKNVFTASTAFVPEKIKDIQNL